MMTTHDRKVIYMRQAVDQVKAAARNGDGNGMAAVVNKMIADGYVDEGHEMAFLIGVTLLSELLDTELPVELIRILILGDDEDDDY